MYDSTFSKFSNHSRANHQIRHHKVGCQPSLMKFNILYTVHSVQKIMGLTDSKDDNSHQYNDDDDRETGS